MPSATLTFCESTDDRVDHLSAVDSTLKESIDKHSSIISTLDDDERSQSSGPDDSNERDLPSRITVPQDEPPASVSRPGSRNRRPKKRNKTSKIWRPLDLRDQAELDNAIIADHSHLAVSTSFDVHAKTFRPSSRLSDIISSNADRRTSLLSVSVTDDIMLKPVRSSGLNAYEIKSDTVNATVTASINKRELSAVFGGELPSVGGCQTHPGQSNGQIQFCVHPNGDVSAHQWFMASYQWLNIGQFSNIRKRTEGQLASDRLRGETESQSLQQNTLAYFRAVAKQRESNVMGTEKSVHSLVLGDVESSLLRSSGISSISSRRTSAGSQNVTLPPRYQKLPEEEVRPKKRLNDFIKGILTREGSQLKVSQSVDDDEVSVADTLSPSDRAKQNMTIKRSVLHDPLRGRPEPRYESVTRPPGLASTPVRTILHEPKVSDLGEPISMLTNPRWGFMSEAIDTKPTPQDFNGPFFSADNPQPARCGEEWAESLDKWFRSGNQLDRQEDFYNTIMKANDVNTLDPTITRLMVPVVENLMSYQGPHKPGMTKFTTPAEWCIDRSPSGNRSFFEQDCGRVPQRIGRDERYRHLAYEGRNTHRRVVPRVPTGLRFS